MRRSSKLWLLLGFIRVFSFSSHAMESEAERDAEGSSSHMFRRAHFACSDEDFRGLPPSFGVHFAVEVPIAYQPSQVSAWMAYYFGEDKAPSLFAGVTEDANTRLVERVVRCMRAADGETLYKLFYEPDVTLWKTFYAQVTGGRRFSTLDLIGLLDQTRTRILDKYAVLGGGVNTQDAHFYVHFLLDLALEKIFGGCWGISNERLPQATINGLKGVYGRVVSGLFRIAGRRAVGELADSLEEQKGQPLCADYERSHLEALQECTAIVLYMGLSEEEHYGASAIDFFKSFREQIGVTLSLSSMQQTMRHVRYKDPFEGIWVGENALEVMRVFRDSRHAGRKIRYFAGDTVTERNLMVVMLPITHDYYSVTHLFGEKELTVAQANDVLTVLVEDESCDVRAKVDYSLRLLASSLVDSRQVGKAVTAMISKLDTGTQAEQITQTIISISQQIQHRGGYGEEGEGKKLQLAPCDQEALLDLYGQAMEAIKPNPNERFLLWNPLRSYDGKSNFDLSRFALRVAHASKDVGDGGPLSQTSDIIAGELMSLLGSGDVFNEGDQRALVRTLEGALAANSSVQTAGNSYVIWRGLLRVSSYTTRMNIIGSADVRALVMSLYIRSLEAFTEHSGVGGALTYEMDDLMSSILPSEREQFLKVLNDEKRFKSVEASVKKQWVRILREEHALEGGEWLDRDEMDGA